MPTSRKLLWIIVAVLLAALIAWYAIAQRNTTSEESFEDETFLNETAEDLVQLEENVNAADSVSEDEAASVDDEALTEDEMTGDFEDISVTAEGFDPKTLTVQAGDTVVWTNVSGSAVYIAPDEHPAHTKYAGVWDDDGTGSIADEESYEFTFTEPGTYTYHDHLETTVTGTIIVE